jgi:hypothetical protein
MNCETAQHQLSAWTDGELSPDSKVELEDHLAECPTCRVCADENDSMDDQLRRALAHGRSESQRVTFRVMNQLTREPRPSMTASTSMMLRTSSRWISLLLATAAGFALALLVLPNNNPPEVVGQNPELAFATVQVATGPIEVAPISREDPAFVFPSDPIVTVGTKMRTGPSRKCELKTTDGTTIRMDVDTQIAVPSQHELVLEKGRMWCQVRGDSPVIEVKSGGVTVQVSQATCDIRSDGQRTELIALNGSVAVVGSKWQGDVQSGNKVSFTSNELIDETPIDNPVIATRWVNDLLLRKGNDDRELQARVQQLWAEFGHSKVQHLYEDELRSLGVGCAPHLLAFINSQDAEHQDRLRREKATLILSDVADFSVVPDLVALLDDPNSQVRFHVAHGLMRLTGRDMGIAAEQWRDLTLQQRRSVLTRWHEWLNREGERFPGRSTHPLMKQRMMKKA